MSKRITNDAELRDAIAFVDGAIVGGGISKAALAERTGLREAAVAEFLSGQWDGSTAARRAIGENLVAAIHAAASERHADASEASAPQPA